MCIRTSPLTTQGATTTDAVANPLVPVDAAIFTTCATPNTSIGITDTIPLPFDTAVPCAVISTGADAHTPFAAHTPSHAYAV